MEEDNFYQGYTDEVGEYCLNDVRLTIKLYHYITKRMEGKFSKSSIRLEHQVKEITSIQERTGFYLDERKTTLLQAELTERLVSITDQMQEIFPPNKIEMKTKVKYEPFNPGSRKRIAKRLIQKGWKPKKYTDKGNIIVDEVTLNSIKGKVKAEAQVLSEYLMIQKRVAQVKSWLEAIDRDTERVHGRVLTLQTVTGRMAHASPNMAQVPSSSSPYGKECRECWTVPSSKKVLVGVDASSIELRILCHYMGNKHFTKEVVSGDIHTINQKILGLETRDQAKTFIYALLYGAGSRKLGSIIGKGAEAGKGLSKSFFRVHTDFLKLKTKVFNYSKEGRTIVGLGKRTLEVRSSHSALNTLLQGGAAIVMKRALVIFSEKLEGRAQFVANVHDEWQLEVDKDLADVVGTMGVEAIKKAGTYYNLKCPLDGEYKVGATWAETH